MVTILPATIRVSPVKSSDSIRPSHSTVPPALRDSLSIVAVAPATATRTLTASPGFTGLSATEASTPDPTNRNCTGPGGTPSSVNPPPVPTSDEIGVPTTCAAIAASGTVADAKPTGDVSDVPAACAGSAPADTLPLIVAPWVAEDGTPVLLGPAGVCGASPPQATQPNATNVSTPIHRGIRMAIPPAVIP